MNQPNFSVERSITSIYFHTTGKWYIYLRHILRFVYKLYFEKDHPTKFVIQYVHYDTLD